MSSRLFILTATHARQTRSLKRLRSHDGSGEAFQHLPRRHFRPAHARTLPHSSRLRSLCQAPARRRQRLSRRPHARHLRPHPERPADSVRRCERPSRPQARHRRRPPALHCRQRRRRHGHHDLGRHDRPRASGRGRHLRRRHRAHCGQRARPRHHEGHGARRRLDRPHLRVQPRRRPAAHRTLGRARTLLAHGRPFRRRRLDRP